jgi:hypothetical protein
MLGNGDGCRRRVLGSFGGCLGPLGLAHGTGGILDGCAAPTLGLGQQAVAFLDQQPLSCRVLATPKFEGVGHALGLLPFLVGGALHVGKIGAFA